MSQEVMDIEKEEPRCEEMATQQLGEELELNTETFNLLTALFGRISGRVEKEQLEAYQRAHLRLSARITADLRIIRVLVSKGYAPQAAVITCSLFEESLNMWYIGTNNRRAQKWFSHNDEIHPVWTVRSLLEKLKEKTGDDLEPHWRKLCQIKHYNPLLGPRFHVKEEYKKIKIHPGPHCNKEHLMLKKAVLKLSSLIVINVLRGIYQSFVKYHISPEKWLEDFKRLDDKIRKLRPKKSQ